MKATVTISCRLIEPEGTWSNSVPVEAADESAIAGFCLKQFTKIMSEGGILEFQALSAPKIEMTLIPFRRIVDLRAVAEIETGSSLDLSGNINSAKADEERTRKINEDLRNLDNFKGRAN